MLEAYQLISDPGKTTITASGGISLGYGPGPGLANAIFWNRIGSLFSCYRPSVGLLNVFSGSDLHQPLHLKQRKALWHPNHVAANYSAPGLRISEDRYASKSGLHCRMTFTNTRKTRQLFVLCFHGSVEQQPFFDYPRVAAASPPPDSGDTGAAPTNPPPKVRCEIDAKRREVTITQPHPHHGLPKVVNSIQRVWLEMPSGGMQSLASCGFGQNEGDLRTLWHDHGALASLGMRLGQVGGRYDLGVGAALRASPRAGTEHGPYPEKLSFSHPHPLYYMTIALELQPGETREVILRTDFHTDDEAGDLRTASEQKRRYPKPNSALKREAAAWRKYLTSEVPQMDCDDAALVRYWYYVWYVLRANRTAPGRHIKQAFTAPSKYMYWGPWIWDGYFHVLGEMWLQDPEVAKNTIRSVLDMQFPNGFIPVCSGANYRMCFHEDIPGYKNPQGGGYASYVDPELQGYKELEHPFEAEITAIGVVGDPLVGQISGRAGARPLPNQVQPFQKFINNEKTQTPLITCAAGEYDSLYNDRAFAKEAFTKLKAFDDWLWRRRTDKQGRFILWHGDESGWDNATRHYPVPAKPFDVQVHSFLHGVNLMGLAVYEENYDLMKGLFKKDDLRRASIKSYWDANDQWHYDFGVSKAGQRTSKRRKQIAAGGLFAMLTEIDDTKVQACLNALNHPRVFNTPYPIPTLAKCDPDYSPHGWGWNGPAWLQVNYFTITGLLGNHKYDEAFDLWEKTKRLIIRDGKPYSYELYDPEIGTGMGCPDYSWQAMINHLIIRYFAGVDTVQIAPHLPTGMDYLAISNLPGHVNAISIKRDHKVYRLELRTTKGWPIWLNTDGLGEVNTVVGNGLNLLRNRAGWCAHDEHASEWEIIIRCR